MVDYPEPISQVCSAISTFTAHPDSLLFSNTGHKLLLCRDRIKNSVLLEYIEPRFIFLFPFALFVVSVLPDDRIFNWVLHQHFTFTSVVCISLVLVLLGLFIEVHLKLSLFQHFALFALADLRSELFFFEALNVD